MLRAQDGSADRYHIPAIQRHICIPFYNTGRISELGAGTESRDSTLDAQASGQPLTE